MKIFLLNFLTTLRRYKASSLLNVVGLALAFAAFYAIMSQVWWEVTFNRSVPHADRVYVAATYGMWGDEKFSPYIARQAMERTLAASPEVEAAAAVNRFDNSGFDEYVWVRRDGAQVPERFSLDTDRARSVTEGILDVLPFRTVRGDLRAVGRPGTVILSRSEAQRLNVDVGGLLYVMQTEPERPLEVTGIYEDLPDNSIGRHLDILCFMGNMDLSDNDQWNTFYYLRLREGSDPEAFVRRWTDIDHEVRQVGRLNERNYTAEPVTLSLIPLSDTYFHPGLELEAGHGNLSVTLTLVGIALLVLLVALINFVNFFLALLPARLRTVNVYKVFGTPTAVLRLNFLFEAVGYVACSLMLAAYLVLILLQTPFAEYFPESLSPADNVAVSAIVAVVAVVTILVVSLWPARYITSFSPALAAKGYVGPRGGRRLRTALVSVQSFVTQCMIVLTLVMWSQYRYMVSADPGFDSGLLLVGELPGDLGRNASLRNAFADHLAGDPQIAGITFASRELPIPNSNWNWSIHLTDERDATFTVINCDTAFLRVLGVGIVEGRDFNRDDARKADGAMIVNARARELYGTAPDEYFRKTGSREIVGVARNIHYASMQYSVGPLLFNLASNENYWLHWLYLRLAPGADVGAVRRSVDDAARQVVASILPGDIDMRFFDQKKSEAYARERRAAMIVTVFGLLAIVISLMGIFGLVLFEMQRRRREVAIRKVMGATSRSILLMFNRRYAAITLGCFVAAVPVAWYFAHGWLAAFAYRTSGVAACFIAALAAVLLVTAATVTLCSWHAANENPADSVKSE